MSTDLDTGIITLPVSDRPLVSILIATRSQAKLLENCLKSLVRNIGDGIAYEIIIVFNAATDEVKSLVRDRTCGSVVLESAANLGVAGGYNRARTAARGEFLLLLHDDTEIEPGWLQALLETLVENPAAGAVGSIQFFPDGTLQRAGSILWQNATTSTPWADGTPDPRILTDLRPVDYVGTCSSIVRTTTWDAIGGMDDAIFPAYFVDVDLCMNIHRIGQTVLCDPRSRVKHHQGASSNNSFRGFMNNRNRAYFVEKWAAALAGYEPAAPDDPTAIDRANRITARRAADLTASWKQHSPIPDPLTEIDSEVQERIHYRKEINLLSDYQKFLETNQIRIKEKLEKANANLKSANEKIQQLKKRCAALKRQSQKKNESPVTRLINRIRKMGRS